MLFVLTMLQVWADRLILFLGSSSCQTVTSAQCEHFRLWPGDWDVITTEWWWSNLWLKDFRVMKIVLNTFKNCFDSSTNYWKWNIRYIFVNNYKTSNNLNIYELVVSSWQFKESNWRATIKHRQLNIDNWRTTNENRQLNNDNWTWTNWTSTSNCT